MGSYALTISSFALESFASSTAVLTASVAVSEPSVPTTMRSNIESSSGCARILTPALGGRSAQLSLTIAIAIEASRQAITITRQIAQRRGMARS